MFYSLWWQLSHSLQFVSLPRSVAWRASWETREGKKMDSYGSGEGVDC